MFDLKTNWFAFLSTALVNICVVESKRRCLGCQHRKYSPLLHMHHQMSLYDKLGCYFVSAKSTLIDGMDQYIAAFKQTLTKANEVLITDDVSCLYGEGVDFLLRSTPSTVYYGRYVEGFNDTYVEDACLRVLLTTQSVNTHRPQQPESKQATAATHVSNTL